MRIKVTFFTLQMISALVAIHVYRYQSLCENSAEGMMVGKKTFPISLGFLELFLSPVVKVGCPSSAQLAI